MKISRILFYFAFFNVVMLVASQGATAQVIVGVRKGYGMKGMLSLNRGEVATDAPNDGYHKTSFENLSRLYWALGMLSEKDDVAVEQFLFINDCDLFNRFSQDPDQWPQLKSATRDMICKRKNDFATRFEVLLPVIVGTLDKSGKQYVINPSSPIKDLKQLDVSDNAGSEVCGSKDDMKSYPRSLLLNLAAPFTLLSVPATPELTSLITAQKNIQKGPTAWLRLKVRIGKYVDTQQVAGSWHAVVTAAIDGYELYNDQDETRILYAQDLPTVSLGDRAERAKKEKAEDVAQDSAPKSGNLNDLYSADKGPAESDYSAPEANNPDDPCARGALPY